MEFILSQGETNSLIKVIGVGGGGSNAVTHMYKKGIVGVDFVICNTDRQNLDASSVPNRIQFGEKGLGAGAKPAVGKDAAIQSIDMLKPFLGEETKMVFITAGMGGGTGTGGAPVVAKECRERGILTVGIVTTPFGWEGKRRKQSAADGVAEFKEYVDTIIIVSNDKLRNLYGNLHMKEAFAKADDVLAIAAKGIAEIITKNGTVNVDFQDVFTVMHNSGVAIMGTGRGSGEARHLKAVREALESPLLNDNDISGAKNILLNICTDENGITMDEFAEISDYIQEAAGGEADIIWGSCVDEEIEDEIKVVLIATGFESDLKNMFDSTRKSTRYTLDDKPADEGNETETTTPEPVQEPVQESTRRKTVVDFETDNYNSAMQKHGMNQQQNEPVDKNIKPVNKVEQTDDMRYTNSNRSSNNDIDRIQKDDNLMKRELIGRNLRLERLSFTTNPDNADSIDAIKREAAYKRRNLNLRPNRLSNQNDASKTSVNKDEGTNFLGRNRFLHPKVD